MRPCGFNSWNYCLPDLDVPRSTELCECQIFSLENGENDNCSKGKCLTLYYSLNLNYSSKGPFVEVMVPSLWHCWVTEEPLREGSRGSKLGHEEHTLEGYYGMLNCSSVSHSL